MIKLKGLLTKKDISKLLSNSSDKNEVLNYLVDDKSYRYCISKYLNSLIVAFPEYSFINKDDKRINCSGIVLLFRKTGDIWKLQKVLSLPIEEVNDFSFFGQSIEMSQDGKVICITSTNRTNETNKVSIFDNYGILKQSIVGINSHSFGNTLILSKNKKQLLISDYIRKGIESKDINIGAIDIYNLSDSGYYIPFQTLTANIPDDHFGQIIYTNYDFDRSYSKLNKIISVGVFSHITEFNLIKDRWVNVRQNRYFKNK